MGGPEAKVARRVNLSACFTQGPEVTAFGLAFSPFCTRRCAGQSLSLLQLAFVRQRGSWPHAQASRPYGTRRLALTDPTQVRQKQLGAVMKALKKELH
jgi:hypothetical protein